MLVALGYHTTTALDVDSRLLLGVACVTFTLPVVGPSSHYPPPVTRCSRVYDYGGGGYVLTAVDVGCLPIYRVYVVVTVDYPVGSDYSPLR